MSDRKKLFLALVLALQTVFAAAQTDNLSPYSRYGIGDLQFSALTPTLSMGHTGIGFSAYNMANILNPASYSDLALVTFAAGVRADIVSLKTENKSALETYTNLSYLNLAFPLRKDTTWGLSFGLLPYSNVDYQMSATEVIPDIGTIQRFYEGTGGFNKVYIGTGFKIGNRIAIGANAGYIFGNITKVRKLEFPGSNTAVNTRVSNILSVSDINVNTGLQVLLIKKEKEKLNFGFTAGLPWDLSAKRDLTSLRYSGNTVIDTVFHVSAEEGHVTLPLHLGAGFMYSKTTVWQERDVLHFGVDYSMQDWSEFESFNMGDSLSNSYKISLGAQYLPDESAQAAYLSRTFYRFGMVYRQSYLEINETGLQEYGITFGLGLPMKPFGINRAPSFINIGAELGMRGTTDNNLIQEQFTRIYLGFNLNDNSWFRKRQYD